MLKDTKKKIAYIHTFIGSAMIVAGLIPAFYILTS